MTVRERYRRGFAAAATIACCGFAVVGGVAYAQWYAPAQATTTQAGATTMPGGVRPSVSANASSVTVAWKSSERRGERTDASDAQVDGYRVIRYDPSGIATPALGACAGVVRGSGCVEEGVPDGAWRYAIRPVLGAVWEGAESSASDPVTVTTVTVTSPANAATYDRAHLTGRCGPPGDQHICGTAAAGPSRTIARVFGSLQQGAGRYWNASTRKFDADAAATATADLRRRDSGGWLWTMPVGAEDYPAGGQYTLRVVVVDSAGRASAATSTFTVSLGSSGAPAPPVIVPKFSGNVTNQLDSSFELRSSEPNGVYRCAVDGADPAPCASPLRVTVAGPGPHRVTATVSRPDGATSREASFAWSVDATAPSALDVQATDQGGAPGRLGPGDTLVFRFREALAPESIMPGWGGGDAAIGLRITPGAGVAGDTLAAYRDASGDRITALGGVDLGQAGFAAGEVTVKATMRLSGSDVIVTIADAGGAPPALLGTVASPGTMVWRPGGGSDLAGNPLANAGAAIEELPENTADVDF